VADGWRIKAVGGFYCSEACMGKVLSGNQGCKACKLVKLVQKMRWRHADEKLGLSDIFFIRQQPLDNW
jgi:hypothetical protein